MDELKKLIKKLKKNRECVSEQELRTRYKTGYTKLKLEIKKEAEKYLRQEILGGIGSKCSMTEAEKLNRIISEGDFLRRISDALMVEMDIEHFSEIVAEMKQVILNEWNNFLETTIELTGLDKPVPDIRNYVTGEEWNYEKQIWQKSEKKGA